MNFQSYSDSVELGDSPPGSLSLPLQALWWDAKGNWDKAHDLCQQAASKEGDWVHAYLHRKEGDAGNASYWYSRSGRPFFEGSLEQEWKEMAETLLNSEE